MKKADIKTGGHYLALVSGDLVVVRVDDINDVEEDTSRYCVSGRPRKASNTYHVTNLATGRKLVFRSAQKFLEETKYRPDMPTKAELMAEAAQDEARYQ